jgi:hypothetical protein
MREMLYYLVACVIYSMIIFVGIYGMYALADGPCWIYFSVLIIWIFAIILGTGFLVGLATDE